MEEAGFDKSPNAAALAGLVTDALELCPSLARAAVAEIWAGLRPESSDALPILGPTKLSGYWLATGHFRNGILLAPITAEVMSSWLLNGSPSHFMGPFLPSRFSL
jgi:glycine oxidase